MNRNLYFFEVEIEGATWLLAGVGEDEEDARNRAWQALVHSVPGLTLDHGAGWRAMQSAKARYCESALISGRLVQRWYPSPERHVISPEPGPPESWGGSVLRVYLSDVVLAEADGRMHMIGRSSSGGPVRIGPLHPDIWYAPGGVTAWDEDERTQVIVKTAASAVEDWHREHAAMTFLPDEEVRLSVIPDVWQPRPGR